MVISLFISLIPPLLVLSYSGVLSLEPFIFFIYTTYLAFKYLLSSKHYKYRITSIGISITTEIKDVNLTKHLFFIFFCCVILYFYMPLACASLLFFLLLLMILNFSYYMDEELFFCCDVNVRFNLDKSVIIVENETNKVFLYGCPSYNKLCKTISLYVLILKCESF